MLFLIHCSALIYPITLWTDIFLFMITPPLCYSGPCVACRHIVVSFSIVQVSDRLRLPANVSFAFIHAYPWLLLVIYITFLQYDEIIARAPNFPPEIINHTLQGLPVYKLSKVGPDPTEILIFVIKFARASNDKFEPVTSLLIKTISIKVLYEKCRFIICKTMKNICCYITYSEKLLDVILL